MYWFKYMHVRAESKLITRLFYSNTWFSDMWSMLSNMTVERSYMVLIWCTGESFYTLQLGQVMGNIQIVLPIYSSPDYLCESVKHCFQSHCTWPVNITLQRKTRYSCYHQEIIMTKQWFSQRNNVRGDVGVWRFNLYLFTM